MQKRMLALLILWLPGTVARAVDLFSLSLEELAQVQVQSRKREEGLFEVPASLLMTDGPEITNQNLSSLEDVVVRMPGVVANPDNPAEPNLFMRGAGSDIESASANPAVGLFLDGVYIPRAGLFSLPLTDLAQIEVLRGPQGSLYGKNVTGGLINLISQYPVDESQTRLSAGFGTDQYYRMQAMTNQPVSERSILRLSASAKGHGGFARNTYTGNLMEDVEQYFMRGQWQTRVDDGLTLSTALFAHNQQGNGRWVDMKIPSDNNRPFKNPDPRRGPNNIDGSSKVEQAGLTLAAQWKQDQSTIDATTAFYKGKLHYSNNDGGSHIDFSQLPMTSDGQVDFSDPAYDPARFNDDYFINTKSEDVDSISQELKWLYRPDSARWQLLTGIYFLREDIQRQEIPRYLFGTYRSQGSENSLSESVNDTYGLFAEWGYDFNARTGMHLGLQYTRDFKRMDLFRATQGDPLGAPLHDPDGNLIDHFSASDKKSWDAFSPSINIQHRINGQHFSYVSFSKGFRSGGWNDGNTRSVQEASYAYGEELTRNLELGMRNQWPSHDLLSNLALFYTRYDDLQTQQLVLLEGFSTPDSLIVNASGARVYGLDFNGLWKPVERWSVGLALSLMDSRITKDLILAESVYDAACDCSTLHESNLKGNQLRRTPRFSATTRMDWRIWQGQAGQLELGNRYSYTGAYQFDLANSRRTRVKGFGIWDANLRFTSTDQRYRINLWANNLTDELYETGITDVIGSVLVSYGPPRMIGLTFDWSL